MPGNRQKQKAQTRIKIINAAIRVYSEKGFSVPTTAIAKEAEVSHGTLFVHFPTVESLLLCLLDVFSRDIINELHLLSHHDNDIIILLGQHIDVLIKYEDFYKRLVKEAVYLPGEAKNTFIEIQSMVSISFLQAIEQDIKEGKIKNIPFHMLFNTWLGLIHYYLLNSDLFSPHGSVLQRYKSTLVECFITLIKQ